MYCWILMLQKVFLGHRHRKVRKLPVRRRFRPVLEPLENRITPSTWTVTQTTDTGVGNLTTHQGDLRWCVANAQTGDTI
jgi:hypothetical protein